MVTVRLVRARLSDDWYYKPVNNYSAGVLYNLTGYGWFYPAEWRQVKELLAKDGIKLTNKWYHIKTKSEPYFMKES